MKKVVLITGVAGFLGSHLANHHLELGDDVWGVDNFSSSSPSSDHIRALLKHTNFTLKQADICSITAYRTVKFDVVYNFACPASPPVYQRMPIETLMTCTLGTKNVLEIARRDKAIVVHASTSEVYGDPIVHPQTEADWGNVNSYGPRSCYDEGKRAAEALCFDYLNTLGVDVRLVRIFNTYGPNMDPNDGRVVSNFICQALRRQPLTVYGEGNQTRSFCYVDDLIRGITALAALEENPRTPVNLGNPNEFTVRHLAHEVQKRLFGDVTFLPLPKDDPRQRKPDISVARSLLGWEPRVQLTEGLDKTVLYFRTKVSQ